MYLTAGNYSLTRGDTFKTGKRGKYEVNYYETRRDIHGYFLNLGEGFDLLESENGCFNFSEDAKVTILDCGFQIESNTELLTVHFKEDPEEVIMPASVDSFELKGFHGILRFPPKVRVEERLFLKDIWYLEELPRVLFIRGNCTITNCESLTTIPLMWQIYGESNFSYNPNLKEVISGAFKDLNLTGCEALTSLPNRLAIYGSLNLEGCKALTELPEGLSVLGDLNLIGSGVKTLPNNLYVRGNIKQGDYHE